MTRQVHYYVFRLTIGVMLPFVPSAETFLSLTLCGMTSDRVVPPQILGDYLLYHLNLVSPKLYTEAYNCGPTNDPMDFLTKVAIRTGKLMPGGYVDFRAAAMEAVYRFRRGALGTWPVDRITPDAFEKRINEEVQVRLREGKEIHEVCAKGNKNKAIAKAVKSKKPKGIEILVRSDVGKGTISKAIQRGRQEAEMKLKKNPPKRPKKVAAEPKQRSSKSSRGVRKSINRNKGTKSRKRR